MVRVFDILFLSWWPVFHGMFFKNHGDERSRHNGGTGMSAFETDDNLMLTENAFPANIKLMETLLASRPDHYPLLTLLAKMYGSYGFVYFEPRLEAGTLKVDYPGLRRKTIRERNRQTD